MNKIDVTSPALSRGQSLCPHLLAGFTGARTSSGAHRTASSRSLHKSATDQEIRTGWFTRCHKKINWLQHPPHSYRSSPPLHCSFKWSWLTIFKRKTTCSCNLGCCCIRSVPRNKHVGIPSLRSHPGNSKQERSAANFYSYDCETHVLQCRGGVGSSQDLAQGKTTRPADPARQPPLAPHLRGWNAGAV